MHEVAATGLGVGVLAFSGTEGRSVNTQTSLAMLDGKLHHVAISVNGSFVKAYVDHQRVVNDPDAIVRPIRRVGLCLAAGGRIANERVMMTSFRLAEGGKDLKAALNTDGRIISHGILFDTGSDRIKGESLPTLKLILGLLQGDPKLRFSVEGHTDDQGGKAVNQPLSDAQRLAVLATIFPPQAGRLTGISPLKSFALGLNAERTLVNGRIVRIANAAQTLHPVAGQGLNLGLRDVHELVHALRRAKDLDQALRRAEWARAADRWSTIATTDFLARSFTWSLPGAASARGLGLAALQAVPGARQWLARRLMFGIR